MTLPVTLVFGPETEAWFPFAVPLPFAPAPVTLPVTVPPPDTVAEFEFATPSVVTAPATSPVTVPPVMFAAFSFASPLPVLAPVTLPVTSAPLGTSAVFEAAVPLPVDAPVILPVVFPCGAVFVSPLTSLSSVGVVPPVPSVTR